MKKILSAALLTTSLIASGTGIIHAEENPAKTPKLGQTAEYQQLQILRNQTKEVDAARKAQGEKNKALWESLKGSVSQEVRDRVKAVLAEIKPLREENKSLAVQLKEAKGSKDKEKIVSLKARLEANHQAIEQKLAPIESELAQVKEMHQSLKAPLAEVKPIREAKKASKEAANQLKQQIKETVASAKESYKIGSDAWQSTLTDAIDLTRQLGEIKSEILTQKTSIYEALQ